MKRKNERTRTARGNTLDRRQQLATPPGPLCLAQLILTERDRDLRCRLYGFETGLRTAESTGATGLSERVTGFPVRREMYRGVCCKRRYAVLRVGVRR